MRAVLLLSTLCAVATPLYAQREIPPVNVGVHLAANASDGTLTDFRFGAQVLFTVLGPIQMSSGFNKYAGKRDPSSGALSGWQGWLNIRVSPFGLGWYVGTGLTAIHESYRAIAVVGFPDSHAATEVSHVVLIGVDLPTGKLRPFLELQALDLGAQIHLMTGVNIRLL